MVLSNVATYATPATCPPAWSCHGYVFTTTVFTTTVFTVFTTTVFTTTVFTTTVFIVCVMVLLRVWGYVLGVRV